MTRAATRLAADGSVAPAATTLAVPLERAVAYLKWVPFAIWSLCAGGMTMGYLIAQAGELRSAKFTVLGGVAGWPEVWGVALMVLGALSLLGRLLGLHGRTVARLRVDGVLLATVAMFGMALWYTVFAASLILGSAAYGYAPYLTLAALHFALGQLTYASGGVRLHPPEPAAGGR